MTQEPNKPLNIEQAGNYLKEKRKTMKEDILKESNTQQISQMPPQDRIKYLTYCIDLLQRVDSDILMHLPDNVRTNYTQNTICGFLKAFLKMKIRGMSDQRLAFEFKVPLRTIENIDVLAQEAVWRNIKKLREHGIPLLGGT